MKYLLVCDIFATQYYFMRNGNVKYKTKIGFCLTIIYMIIVLALFMGFGINLYTRKNPKVSFNTLLKPYEEKKISNLEFLLAYRIEDYNGIELIDDTILKLKLNLFKYKLIDGQWQDQNSEFDVSKTRCSDIPSISHKEKYYNISLKNWYCINFENHILGGNWDSDFVNYYNIQTNQCKNGTSYNITCKPQDTITKMFHSDFGANYYFSYLYMEAMPTLDDYDQPIKSNIVNRYEKLNTKLTKTQIHTLKEAAVNDDRGWIFSDVELKYIYASDNLINDFSLKDEINEIIVFDYCMYFGKKYEVYNRSYMKIQEVIASIGGFSKIFHLIVSFGYGYISDIMKNFDLIERSNNNIYNQPNYDINFKVKDNKVDLSNSSKIEINITKNLNNISSIDKKKEFDLYLIIKNKFCFKKFSTLTKEEKINILYYEKINKYHNDKLDVITYLKLFKEFNILKKILLDDIQYNTLEIIDNKYTIDEPVNKDLFLPILKEYFNKTNNYSEINKRLFSFFKFDEVKNNNFID